MQTLAEFAESAFTQGLSYIVLSKPVFADSILKIKIRPILYRKELGFQAESYTKTQVFHKNMTAGEAVSYLQEQLPSAFLSLEAEHADFHTMILANKKGTITIKTKKKNAGSSPALKIELTHNRKKQYILEEGKPVPFLVDLGVMTEEGQIIHARYDKFRQINRFLEYIEDILPCLPKDRTLEILDFGCGKSYLTFAMYYYLHDLKGYRIRVTGLDLKEEVIRHCSELAVKYGYEGLEFLCSDVAYYESGRPIDMMVTLHACDTATDYALAKAAAWKARVILSVPCCQHELNKQIKNDLLSPVLDYGILKERMSALITDGLRAKLLEEEGYKTQILEFIDMEHTPKNLLIRAVKSGKPTDRAPETQALLDSLSAKLTLEKLLKRQRQEQAAREQLSQKPNDLPD